MMGSAFTAMDVNSDAERKLGRGLGEGHGEGTSLEIGWRISMLSAQSEACSTWKIHVKRTCPLDNPSTWTDFVNPSTWKFHVKPQGT